MWKDWVAENVNNDMFGIFLTMHDIMCYNLNQKAQLKLQFGSLNTGTGPCIWAIYETIDCKILSSHHSWWPVSMYAGCWIVVQVKDCLLDDRLNCDRWI